MTLITVVGAGVMGTAISIPALDNGHTVRLVGTHLDADIIASVQERNYHPKLRRTLPTANLTAHPHTDLPTALPDADIVVLGVNSQGVHWAAQAIGPHLRPGQTLLMVTKGMEAGPDGTPMILPDVLRAALPETIRDRVLYAAVGGPSIAGELAARRHTAVVFCSRDADVLPTLRATFATPYYHIWTTTDVIGVEVCVALKNPYALAVGLATGMLEAREAHDPDEAGAKMHNTAAALFAQGLAETAYLVERLGGLPQTVYSLPGAGDLYVTTQGGRNSRMGRLLGLGLPYSDAVEEMPGETVEGIDAVIAIVPALQALAAAGQFDLSAVPLLTTLHHVVTRGAPPDFAFESFFSRLPFDAPHTHPVPEPETPA